MKIIAVVNQKGGVGKTTTAVHLAYRAREKGFRVLMVDLDPQGSTSFVMPSVDDVGGITASELFASELSSKRPESLGDNLSIIRADDGLGVMNEMTKVNRTFLQRPKRYLKTLEAEVDVCIIDTPGTLSFAPPMTAGALVCAHSVICPFPVGALEVAGLKPLLNHLKTIKEQGYNSGIKILGFLPSKINTKSKKELEALAGLRVQLGQLMLPVLLAERSAVKQATGSGEPVWRATSGAGHRAAGKEWRDAMDLVLNKMGVL